MIRYLDLLLPITIWFLLTADLTLANVIMGIGIALVLPRRYTGPAILKDWLWALWKVIIAIPAAYIEAFEIIFIPHNQEVFTLESVKPKRTPGLIFLDIFLITFTPKTIAVRYHQAGWYQVHQVQRERNR